MEEILKMYGVYIYNYAFKLTANPQNAEDLAQDTFLKAWQKREMLKNEASVKWWLRKICFNIFLMNIRNKPDVWMEEDLELLETHGDYLKSELSNPENEIVVEESVRELQNGCFLAMVHKLTLQQRIAFSLVDMFGLPIEEVADLLGISKGALKGLLYRARRSLDSFYANHCEWIQDTNPCKCSAWVTFWQKRDQNQDNMKKVILKRLDYKKCDVKYNTEVRRRVKYLYKNMSDKVPEQEWYDRVIASLEINPE